MRKSVNHELAPATLAMTHKMKIIMISVMFFLRAPQQANRERAVTRSQARLFARAISDLIWKGKHLCSAYGKTQETVKKTFLLCAPLRYAHAFGRAELFIVSSFAARLKPCPDTSSRPNSVFPQPLNSCPDTTLKLAVQISSETALVEQQNHDDSQGG
jgi:hypothetical protein